MKRLVMQPDGWPCALGECRPGHFVWQDNLCFKDEYGPEVGNSYDETGSIFWGGTKNKDDRAAVIVQPVSPAWEEYGE